MCFNLNLTFKKDFYPFINELITTASFLNLIYEIILFINKCIENILNTASCSKP